jgi:hypothetical protein
MVVPLALDVLLVPRGGTAMAARKAVTAHSLGMLAPPGRAPGWRTWAPSSPVPDRSTAIRSCNGCLAPSNGPRFGDGLGGTVFARADPGTFIGFCLCRAFEVGSLPGARPACIRWKCAPRRLESVRGCSVCCRQKAADLQVNSHTPDFQFRSTAAIDDGGDFVVAWDSGLQDGSHEGVFAQRFSTPAVIDIDGNGQITALTDGLLILRFLFGFTGSALVAGAIDVAGCTRCDAAAIEGYLQTLI